MDKWIDILKCHVVIDTEQYKGQVLVKCENNANDAFIYGKAKEHLRVEKGIVMPYGYEGFKIINKNKNYGRLPRRI